MVGVSWKFDRKEKWGYNSPRNTLIWLYLFFHSMKDFFTRYRESRKHYYIVPGIFGLLFGFAIVAQMTWTSIDIRTLQANVLEANTPKILYNADFLMEKSWSTLTFRIGKDAEMVDFVSFSLLWDPSILSSISSTDPNLSIVHNEPWVFFLKYTLNKNLKAGEMLFAVDADMQWETPIALLDPTFQSQWSIYSLSVWE